MQRPLNSCILAMHKHMYICQDHSGHHDNHLIATDITHTCVHMHTHTHTHTPIISLNYSSKQFVSAHKLVSKCTQISLQWYHVYSVVHDCLMYCSWGFVVPPVLGSVWAATTVLVYITTSPLHPVCDIKGAEPPPTHIFGHGCWNCISETIIAIAMKP